MVASLVSRIAELERRLEQLLTRFLALQSEVRRLRQIVDEIAAS